MTGKPPAGLPFKPRRRFGIRGSGVVAALVAFMCFGNAATAQEPAGILNPGDMVVTGFSGTTDHGVPAPEGVDPISALFIDLDGPSMQILRAATGGEPNGQLIDAPASFKVRAGEIGQVFGIALDNGANNDGVLPNIYVGQSSAFGVQIVLPDADGDGRPERVSSGAAEASFMQGQFGDALGGGAGTIYKVDGVTGEVSIFAELETDGQKNSGPGIGNIAYDKDNGQFFASDLDTGMIHRMDAEGNLVDSFDHGVAGRAVEGLEVIADDAESRMDITSPEFSTEDPETWGLTAPERRVWGLAVNGGRLYYAVSDGPQVWSVGINEDGSFAEDPRKEFDVETDGEPHPVSDMAFDENGLLYLAQRGGLSSSRDYTIFAKAGESKVLRYRLADGSGEFPQWEPAEEYAIGLKPDHTSASGGVTLGQYEGKCNFVWSTGDALRDAPDVDGEPIVHGLQGNDQSLVRPENVPPLKAVYVDYDMTYSDPQKEGHVGDVESYRKCEGEQAEGYGEPGYLGELEPGGEPGEPWCTDIYWFDVPFCPPGDPDCRPQHRKFASPVHRKAGSPVHWKRGSPVHRKAGSPVHWKAGSPVHWKRGSPVHWKRGSPVHWKKGSPVHWKKGSPVHWKRGSPVHWKKGSPVHWKKGSPVHLKMGSPVHWKRGSPGFWSYCEPVHTKAQTHFKYASHNRRLSHRKFGSHNRRLSHRKQGSHSRRESHNKHGSHNRRLSHRKHGSHNRRLSHRKHGSHSRRQSHNKHGSHNRRLSHRKQGSHSRRESHNKQGSHNRRLSHRKQGSHSRRESHNKQGSHNRRASHRKQGSHSRRASHRKQGSHKRRASHLKQGSRPRTPRARRPRHDRRHRLNRRHRPQQFHNNRRRIR